MENEKLSRRDFLGKILSLFTFAAIAAAYATFLSFAGRFLYPAQPRKKKWLYVARAGEMKKGDNLTYISPIGEKIAVARQKEGGGAEDFVALSSTCPHLGCQVHWEGPRERFFCPCHNGAFDAGGAPIEGPPSEAGQSLPKYPLKVDNGLLLIEVPIEKLQSAVM